MTDKFEWADGDVTFDDTGNEPADQTDDPAIDEPGLEANPELDDDRE